MSELIKKYIMYSHNLFPYPLHFDKTNTEKKSQRLYSSTLKTFHLVKMKALLQRRIFLGLLNAATGFFDRHVINGIVD